MHPPPVEAVPPPAITAPPPATLLARGAPVARPRELIAMLALVALADVGLYQRQGGVGAAILLLGAPAVLAAQAAVRRGSRRLASIAALLGLVALRCVWQTGGAVIALGLGLLLPFAIALRTPRSYLPELACSALSSLTGALGQLRGFVFGVGRLMRPRRARDTAALVVPAALVLVFGAIFAAANPAIQGWLARFAELFDGAWSPSAGRVVFWAGSAVIAAGLLRPVLRSIAGLDRRLGTSERAEPSAAGAAATQLALARNGMIALNVLFLGYNAIDAVYLWAGRAPAGVSFTEYAHAGAAWLTIAFLLGTIVLGAMFRGPIEHDPRG
ncbi:MAG TPA: DUF4153 domain-containing protein, partial [Kofleriaceae bacterium]